MLVLELDNKMKIVAAPDQNQLCLRKCSPRWEFRKLALLQHLTRLDLAALGKEEKGHGLKSLMALHRDYA